MNEQSNTKSTSTRGSLERFLIDSDCDPGLVDYLNRLGFRARSILTVNIPNQDVRALSWARQYGYILVCHDHHRDTQTRYAFYEEMYRKGGREMRIGGEPGQDALFALGKILAQRPAWQKFFDEHENGRVIVHMTGCKVKTAAQLYEQTLYRVQLPFKDDPAMAMRDRLPTPKQPRKPRPQPVEARRLPI